MASLLYRIGSGAVRHRLIVLILWAFALIGVGIGSNLVASQMDAEISIPGLESTIAGDVVADEFGDQLPSVRVVVEVSDREDLTDESQAARVRSLRAGLETLPSVASVSDPFDSSAPSVSEDFQAAYLTVHFDAATGEVPPESWDALTDVVDASSTRSFTVAATGDAPPAPHDGTGELIGIVLALLILAITLGSLVLAGMNIIAALVGVGISILSITVVSGFVELASTTSVVALMLGLAVGIDYSLLIITRFRQELIKGRPVADAAGMAIGTAGSAVVVAGVTVVIALGSLSVVGISFLTQMGLAAAGTVVIAVLVATTLMPALLGYLGTRALSRRQRAHIAAHTAALDTDVPRGFFSRWASAVTRGRWVVLLVAVAVLAIVASPFTAMRTSLLASAEAGSTQARADEILDKHFGAGFDGPLVVLVQSGQTSNDAGDIAEKIADMNNVALVAPPIVSESGRAALITIIPDSGPTSAETEDLVHEIRERFQGGSGPEVAVTGATAASIDVSERINAALPLYVAIIVGLALVLLVLVFRSIIVPVIGVIGFLVTLAASFGAATAVFQWGWFAEVLGTTPGLINSVTPIMMVGVLFGLAMDYQVFLVSRIHEAHTHGMTARDAIASGIRSAGPVIVAAALIMFGVFAGFFSGGDETVKPIAFTLAVGILIDAIVVRMLIIPAALSILGDVAWKLPRWLEWLPSFDIEGSKLTDIQPARNQAALQSPAGRD